MARHAADGPVDWRSARLGEPLPCVVCGRPALLRHPVTQRPHHKVCDPDAAAGAA
jgi:hypothetical protein